MAPGQPLVNAGRPEPASSLSPFLPCSRFKLFYVILRQYYTFVCGALECVLVYTQFLNPAPVRGPSRFCPHPKGRRPPVHMQSGRLALRSSQRQRGDNGGKAGKERSKTRTPLLPGSAPQTLPALPARAPTSRMSRPDTGPRLGRPEDEPLSVVKHIASATAQRP